ncbi:uncharacterized protein HMPREF1541_03999 [Cyphellophora europaea CBS 101466]|uniref:HORMA domain-containing protein n=1 Tax=Cyphellophora europaea (strain CBS 101466) TaxID=1220924 RepID=W2S0D7_CYPE1|nr:uncharacterized protein HMPREF1541_03999 [Cyphellophora europaea CBS 101466]ETN42060.1 hypothetical protein HMPREF1541_03999 [Cyphellophora europaea CBS 101466]
MATVPPPTNPNLISTPRALLSTLTSFLAVTTHQILYLRRIYPPASFLTTRAYNHPVHQNRHPAVCSWINDAIAAVGEQLAKTTVSHVSLCIHELDTNAVLERWTFDLHSLPTVARRDRDVPFAFAPSDDADADADQDQQQQEQQLPQKLNLTDLEATFRACLSRLSSTTARLKPLPFGPDAPELTFTLTIELRPNADRPVGRLDEAERRWIVAEEDPVLPIPAVATNDSTSAGGEGKTARAKTHPIRRLSAAPLHIEMWVEESAHKLSLPATATGSSRRDAATRAAETSFGAGTEKFDPLNGYEDLEGTDLNRKPGGGAMTDYQRM